jgi:murein L,D-transpeptidase YafK
MGKIRLFGAFFLFALGVQNHAEAASAPAAMRADHITIHKNAHTMVLAKGEATLATYAVAIGPGGAGVKHREGDKVTPVGRYHIVSRSPSVFHIFMRLDYPNADDRARFAALKADGTLPKNATIGGDVGIHGAPAQAEWKKIHKTVDWTFGCIAVDDDEIEKVAAMVPDGTIVDIED